MSTEALSLNQLVDLALGTPDVGAVNFNVLHTLLHAVINKLDIGAVKAEISEADKNYLALNRDGSLLSAPSRASTVGKDSGLDTDGESGREDTSGIIPHRHSHHHLLEKKVAKLEDKLNSLDKLPSNEDLFNSTKGQGKKNAVSEMWQNMQLAKRVDANEGGVSKLMSMVEDLLRDMAELKEENENIKRQIAGLDVDDLRDRLKALEDTTDSLNKKFEELPRMPGQDFWDAFVTWEGLENALRGIREDLAPVPATVIEMSVQTDPPRPASNRPSKELADLLEKLGLLTKEHDLLSGRVDKLEEDMENKADRSELDAIKVPDELLDILKKLQMDMDALNKNRERSVMRLNAPGSAGSRPSRQMINNYSPRAQQSELLRMHSPDSDKSLTADISLTGEGVLTDQMSSHTGRARTADSSGIAGRVKLPPISISPVGTYDLPDAQNDDRSGANNKADGPAAKLPRPVEFEGVPGQFDGVSGKWEAVPVYGDDSRDGKVGAKGSKSSGSGKDGDRADRSDRPDHELQRMVFSPSLSVEAEELGIGSLVGGELIELKDRLDKLETGDMDELWNKITDMEGQMKNMQGLVDEMSSLEKTFSDSALGSEESDLRVPSVRSMMGAEMIMAKQGLDIKNLADKLKECTNANNAALMKILKRLERVEADLTDLSDKALLALNQAADLGINDVDTDALNRAHRAISNLQTELEKLKSTTEFLVDENTSKTEQLSSLVTATQQLEEKKADREYVEAGLDLKADKQALDAKVNRSQFETTIADLNKMIDDILAKLEGHDEEWRRAIAELTKELDCKIDRLELDALKDYLESRLKALSNKIKASNADILTDDDAAGIRKQLLQRYNCISCDRPVDMYPHGPAAALPAPGPMPGMKSARPYTTFELEQIRQQAKLNRGGRGACNYERAVFERELGRLRRYDLRSYMAYYSRRAPNFGGPEAAELYSTARSCGGTHTMTYPHRRITRLNQLATLFHEDDPATSPVPQPSLNREELDIMGADGHIYKGRFDKIDSQRLPSVKQQPHMVRTTSPRLERAKTTVSPASRHVDVSPRPLSARHSRTQMDDRPRPASARIPSPQDGGDERPNTPATQKAE